MKDRCQNCLHKGNCKWIYEKEFCPLDYDGFIDNIDNIALTLEDLNDETI